MNLDSLSEFKGEAWAVKKLMQIAEKEVPPARVIYRVSDGRERLWWPRFDRKKAS